MKTPMTKRGAELLREELHRLKAVERPANAAAIAEARAHGDLSENAEYHAARERAGFIEGRISELESKLANAQVIDPKLVDADGRLRGSWVSPGMRPAFVERLSYFGMLDPWMRALQDA